MSGVNKVILLGNVGKDPVIKALSSGDKVASFSIATSETWKDKGTGEKREKTEWSNIVIYNEGLIGIVEKYVKKGSKLYIEGALQTRKWTDQSGVEKYTTEVVLQKFRGEICLLGAGSDGEHSVGAGAGDERRPASKASSSGSGVATAGQDFDEDIPF